MSSESPIDGISMESDNNYNNNKANNNDLNSNNISVPVINNTPRKSIIIVNKRSFITNTAIDSSIANIVNIEDSNIPIENVNIINTTAITIPMDNGVNAKSDAIESPIPPLIASDLNPIINNLNNITPFIQPSLTISTDNNNENIPINISTTAIHTVQSTMTDVIELTNSHTNIIINDGESPSPIQADDPAAIEYARIEAEIHAAAAAQIAAIEAEQLKREMAAEQQLSTLKATIQEQYRKSKSEISNITNVAVTETVPAVTAVDSIATVNATFFSAEEAEAADSIPSPSETSTIQSILSPLSTAQLLPSSITPSSANPIQSPTPSAAPVSSSQTPIKRTKSFKPSSSSVESPLPIAVPLSPKVFRQLTLMRQQSLNSTPTAASAAAALTPTAINAFIPPTPTAIITSALPPPDTPNAAELVKAAGVSSKKNMRGSWMNNDNTTVAQMPSSPSHLPPPLSPPSSSILPPPISPNNNPIDSPINNNNNNTYAAPITAGTSSFKRIQTFIATGILPNSNETVSTRPPSSHLIMLPTNAAPFVANRRFSIIDELRESHAAQYKRPSQRLHWSIPIIISIAFYVFSYISILSSSYIGYSAFNAMNDNIVIVGLVLHLIGILLLIIVVMLILRFGDPFHSITMLLFLFSLTSLLIGTSACTNPRHSAEMAKPLFDTINTAVQAQWIGSMILLLIFIYLLYRTPRVGTDLALNLLRRCDLFSLQKDVRMLKGKQAELLMQNSNQRPYTALVNESQQQAPLQRLNTGVASARDRKINEQLQRSKSFVKKQKKRFEQQSASPTAVLDTNNPHIAAAIAAEVQRQLSAQLSNGNVSISNNNSQQMDRANSIV